MKAKIIKVLINGVIGILTSIATIYLGASTVEAVTASGLTTSAVGERASDAILSILA